jgi:hypothetical protein
MDLHELARVGGRATSGRAGRRLEWFAEVCGNHLDGPRFGDERDQPDVTAAVGHRGIVLAGLTIAGLTAGKAPGQDIFPTLEMRPSGTLVEVTNPA